MVILGKGAHTPSCDPKNLTKQLLESLDRMKTDYIDLYMLHRDNLEIPVGEFIDVLNEHKRAGRIRAFGGSNWTLKRLQVANDYAKKHGLTPFVASSSNLSLAVWNEPMWADCVSVSDPESRAWHHKTKMPLFAWSSQASGFFTGRFGAKDRNDPALSDIVRVWFDQGNFRRLERARELAKKKGVTANQIALAYVLCQPFEMYALIGPQTLEEIRTSAQALEVKLTPKELRWLNLEK